MRRPSHGLQIRKEFDLGALREIPFMAWLFSCFFAFLGLYVPIFYLQLYAVQQGIISRELSPYLLALLNAGSFFGRIVSLLPLRMKMGC